LYLRDRRTTRSLHHHHHLRSFTDSVFTARSTRGRMSIKTAAGPEFLQMSLEILSQSTRKMMSVFSAVSKQVTFLAEAYFVRRLKGTSFTTALGAALIRPWPWRMALS